MFWEDCKTEEKVVVRSTGRKGDFESVFFFCNLQITISGKRLDIPDIFANHLIIGEEKVFQRPRLTIRPSFPCPIERNIIGLIVLRDDFTVLSLKSFLIQSPIIYTSIKQKRLIKQALSVILEIGQIRNLVKNRFNKGPSFLVDFFTMFTEKLISEN